jgi:hypothetical protein
MHTLNYLSFIPNFGGLVPLKLSLFLSIVPVGKGWTRILVSQFGGSGVHATTTREMWVAPATCSTSSSHYFLALFIFAIGKWFARYKDVTALIPLLAAYCCVNKSSNPS